MPLKYTPEQRIKLFWSKVNIMADDNLCWEWQGWLDKDGYGKTKYNQRNEVVSRLAWMYPNYVIPEGMLICHSCDNPKCCNPKHLFLGTPLDNMTDKMMKGRHIAMRGEVNHWAKLTANQVIEIRKQYAEGNVTQRELSQIYNVTRECISRIVCRYSWKEIE